MANYYVPLDGSLKLYMMRPSNVYTGIERLHIYKGDCTWEELDVEGEKNYQNRLQCAGDRTIILIHSQEGMIKTLREISEEEAQDVLQEIERDDGYYLEDGICCCFD